MSTRYAADDIRNKACERSFTGRMWPYTPFIAGSDCDGQVITLGHPSVFFPVSPQSHAL